MKTICARCGARTIMPFGDVTRNPLCRSCFNEQQPKQDRESVPLDNETVNVDWDAALGQLLKEGR